MMITKLISLGDTIMEGVVDAMILYEIDRSLRELLVNRQPHHHIVVDIIDDGNMIRIAVDDNIK